MRTVLVVDDEPMVEETIEAFAARLGCKHQSFNDPLKALAYFEDNYTTIDFAIIDLSMPGMSGLELTDRMHSVSPDLPVIIITGVVRIEDAEIMQHKIAKVIHKPVTKDEFINALNETRNLCAISEEAG